MDQLPTGSGVFVLSPTFGHSHASSSKRYLKVIQAFIPLRFETLIILGWLVLCAVFCGTSIYASEDQMASLLVGNRSGQLSGIFYPIIDIIWRKKQFHAMVDWLAICKISCVP